MALTFNSKSIPGTTLSIVYGSPEAQVRRGRFWNLNGEVEIVGTPQGRDIAVAHIVHDACSKHSDLIRKLDAIEALQSSNGKLTYSTSSGSTLQEISFSLTTLDRYELLTLEGQPAPGPLKDITGTLFGDSGSADNGWFQAITLYFRQLAS